jgi:ubiquinone/menaquinone biosynthesis C-methylase UbiE
MIFASRRCGRVCLDEKRAVLPGGGFQSTAQMAACIRPPEGVETMTKSQILTETPAEKYETFFVPAIFGPWARRLVELAGIERGQTLLDLACGTGIVARAVAPLLGREGRIVALDLRPGMLAAARALPVPDGAAIEWLEADAQATGLPDGAFDHVVCQAGLQFFPDRAKALAEARRMLKPGGRLTVLVWQELEKQGLLHAMAEHEYAALKPLGVTWDEFNQPFELGDPEELRDLLAGAGFRRIEIFQEGREVRFGDADNFVFNMEYAYAAVIPEFAADAQAFESFVELVRRKTHELVEAHRQGDMVVTHMNANMAVALK